MTEAVARADRAGVSAVAAPGLARDLVALCKPRITTMVVATGVAGALAAPARVSGRALPALLGTAMIVAGANALNMWIERDTDARMERTRDRPLAAGRLSPTVGLLFGLAISVLSIPLLLWANVRVAAMGVLAWLAYVVVYTPMKRFTRWALPVGAIAGAMPPAMGWAAATGHLEGGGLYLFALLFFWQLPHFMAIAMVRRDEYAAAGLAVGGERTRVLLVAFALAFVALTIATPLGGALARGTAVVTGAAFLILCVRAARAMTRDAARDAFAFTMAHLALLLVAVGIR